MGTQFLFTVSPVRLAIVGATLFILCAPFSASAASVVIGSIDVSSLTMGSSKQTLSGLAFGAKTVKVTIHKEGSTKVVYRSKAIKVKNNKWEAKISKKLPSGVYDVVLSSAVGAAFSVAPSGVLTIGSGTKSSVTSATTLVINPISLLQGGVARAGSTVPVSYLQISNVGKLPASLKGFWITQNGSASTQSVVGLTTVDDKGGSRGSSGGTEGSNLFTKGVAFAPTEATTVAPGQMRLFTIKATLTANVSQFIGGQLSLVVTSVESNAKVIGTFPIRGTTWTIAN